MEKVIISACLVGERVRYDGDHQRQEHPALALWRAQSRLVAVCPEVWGGLPVPRQPAEIAQAAGGAAVLAGQGRLLTLAGEDVTREFLAGAHRVLELAQREGVRVAILKDGSPSCGSTRTYDGAFSGTSIALMGVTAALLEQHGIRVFNERAIDQAAQYLAYVQASSEVPE